MYDTDLLTRIAKMYYLNDMTQQEIADAEFLSRSVVSRMIKQAKALGIVEIGIKPAFENYIQLEKELKKRFPNCDFLISYSENSDAGEEFNNVCNMAADLLDKNLDNDSILSVSRGKTINNVCSLIKPSKNNPDMNIVQLAGSLTNMQNNSIDEMNNMQKIAVCYGCQYNRFYAPYLMDDKETKKVMCHHGDTKKVLDMAKNVNTFISGVDTILFWNDHLDSKDITDIIKDGAVGCMWGYFFDIDGNFIDTPLYNRMIIPDIDIFKNVKTRICVANDRFKTTALLGGLRGNLFNYLVTNSKIASRLIDLNDSTN